MVCGPPLPPVANPPPAGKRGRPPGDGGRRCRESHPAPHGAGPGCGRLRRVVAGGEGGEGLAAGRVPAMGLSSGLPTRPLAISGKEVTSTTLCWLVNVTVLPDPCCCETPLT